LDGSPLAIRRKGGVEDFKRTILRDEQQAAPVCSCSVQSSKTQDAEDSRLHDRIAALQRSKAVRCEVSLFVAVALGASWGGSYIVGVSVDG